jgi:hypothetical protein
MKSFIIIIISICTLCVFPSCSEKKVQLEEVQTQKIPDVKKLPPLRGMISEIEEVSGEQKIIYIKLGNKNEWYKKGLIGYVYNDVSMKEQIAKFEVIDVYENYSKGVILELNYTIKNKAVVEVEIDPRFLIKK